MDEEIRAYLTSNLRIHIKKEDGYHLSCGETDIEISLTLDGEEISCDTIYIRGQ